MSVLKIVGFIESNILIMSLSVEVFILQVVSK